jgi:hypothetical protein
VFPPPPSPPPVGVPPPAGRRVVRPRVPRERVVDRRGFFAVLARLDGAPAAFARLDAGFLEAVDLRAGLLRAALLRALLLRVVDFARVELLRAPDERFAPVRDEVVEPVLASMSIVHLPDITRCAASATASAINEPSFVALAIMLLAAWDAVSAASRPASRIARRALGLALIAAAAAARPAASISLLIAALASLSTVSLPEEEVEELLRADLAMASFPSVREKDTSRL